MEHPKSNEKKISYRIILASFYDESGSTAMKYMIYFTPAVQNCVMQN
jgi:hypothetical protein